VPKKLTEDEKLANKEALKVKRAAHTARRRAADAREQQLLAERVAPLQVVMDTTREAYNTAFKERDAYDLRCSEEIAELRRRHQAGRAPYEDEVGRTAAAHRDAVNARNSETSSVQAQVATEFHDLVGHARYSVACWTPPKETS